MEVSTLGGGEDEDGNEIEGEEGDAEVARAVFARGYKELRARGEKEDVSWDGLAAFCSMKMRDSMLTCAASTLTGGLEIVRTAARQRRGGRKGARDDADNEKEVAQGRGRQRNVGRV